MKDLLKTLDEVSFFSIMGGNIWEIDSDYKEILIEAMQLLKSDIEDLASNGITSSEEINFFLKGLVCRFYSGVFHLIVQNKSVEEMLDSDGNFKWAPVKKRLAAVKSELRVLKEYMEAHARKDPGLRFSLENGAENLDQALNCVNHVLVTHSNMAKM